MNLVIQVCKSTKEKNELAKFNKKLKVDKDFGEEDVTNEVESYESTKQDLQVMKEKVDKQVIFQSSKNILFLFMFWWFGKFISIYPWNLSYYPI